MSGGSALRLISLSKRSMSSIMVVVVFSMGGGLCWEYYSNSVGCQTKKNPALWAGFTEVGWISAELEAVSVQLEARVVEVEQYCRIELELIRQLAMSFWPSIEFDVALQIVAVKSESVLVPVMGGKYCFEYSGELSFAREHGLGSMFSGHTLYRLGVGRDGPSCFRTGDLCMRRQFSHEVLQEVGMVAGCSVTLIPQVVRIELAESHVAQVEIRWVNL